MTDVFTAEQRSAVMRRVHSKDTAPELCVRRAAHRLGLRYRLHVETLPGTPDLVFPKSKSVVFVHGCYWHQHGCPASVRPTSHQTYWNAKLDRNVVRDRTNIRLLTEQGWRVLIVWECETRCEQSLEDRLSSFLRGDMR